MLSEILIVHQNRLLQGFNATDAYARHDYSCGLIGVAGFRFREPQEHQDLHESSKKLGNFIRQSRKLNRCRKGKGA
jgi:hypothetical protein